jgi:hypothetical protein
MILATLSRLVATLLLASTASSVLAAPSNSALETIALAPLLSKDPAKPLEVIAFDWWVATDRVSPALREKIDARQQIQAGKAVTVGSFTVDDKKGPVSLVVDFGAVPKSRTGATGTVRISIECMGNPMACAIPLPKTLLLFRSELMSSVPVDVGGQAVPLLIGRDSHSYRLPAGETVRVQLELGTQNELEPVLLKGWLIYGQNEAEVVPGQTSKSTFIWLLVGIGVLVLVLVWWRLARR